MPDDMSVPKGGRALLPLLVLALVVVLALVTSGETVDEDLEIKAQTDWDAEEYTVSANIAVMPGGHLNITDATVTFVSSEEEIRGIVVYEGGRLTMTGVTVQAQDLPYAMLAEGGEMHLTDTHLSGLVSYEEGLYTFEIGGLMAQEGLLYLQDVTIEYEGAGIVTFESQVHAEGLEVIGNASGEGNGILVYEGRADFTDLDVSDLGNGLLAWNSTVTLEDFGSSGNRVSIIAVGSDIGIDGLSSDAYGYHVVSENSTINIRDGHLQGGTAGLVVTLGYAEIVGCTIEGLQNAIELVYCEAVVRDCFIEGSIDEAIVMESIGYMADEPRFEMDNITLVNGTEAAITLRDCLDLVLTNITISNHGDGINAYASTFTLLDSSITGSSPFCTTGCSYSATGTGIVLSRSEDQPSMAWLGNVTILDSYGPAVSAYFSYINATGSAFNDGGASGFVLVYSLLSLGDCEVSGNAMWGVETLAYDVDPDEQDAVWGNARADIRFNMTINAQVVDQHGTWLSHATVTVRSGQTEVGPFTTGYWGSTDTIELPVSEWTDGEGTTSYNPWTFEVVYGTFSNSTPVELQLGLGNVELVVEVLRADLVVDKMSLPDEAITDEEASFSASVRNQGTLGVDSALVTFYYRDENGFQRVMGEVSVGPIGPGEDETATVTWRPPGQPGRFTIVAFVDVDDRVDEEDEDNNSMEQELEVQESGGTTPSAGALAAVAALALAIALVGTSRGRRS